MNIGLNNFRKPKIAPVQPEKINNHRATEPDTERCPALAIQKQEGGLVPMIEFISENWQIMTALVAAVAYMYRQILATRKGIRALLRADLIRLYNKYHDDLGYCPVYVKQSLEDEYQQYHALKGNGVGTNLYNALMALPTEPPEKKED